MNDAPKPELLFMLPLRLSLGDEESDVAAAADDDGDDACGMSAGDGMAVPTASEVATPAFCIA